MRTRLRLLVVDDNEMLLRALQRGMQRFADQWEVSFTRDGTEACALLEQGSFDIVIADLVMPPVDGRAVLIAARKFRPATIRVLLTATPERVQLGEADFVLSKPCSLQQLVSTVEMLWRPIASSTDNDGS